MVKIDEMGKITGVFSGFILVISPFLPWVEWSIFETGGFDKPFRTGGILVFFGALVVILAIIGTPLFTGRRYRSRTSMSVSGTFFGGIIVLIGALSEYTEDISDWIDLPGVDIGLGWYLAVAGGFLAIISAFIQTRE